MATEKKTASTTKAAAAETVQTALAPLTESASEATKNMTGVFSALTTSGRKAVEGIIEVNKALLGYAGAAFKGYVELGRQSVAAKSVNDLLDLHVAYAHDQTEQNAANTREVVDLAQRKAQEAYEPLKDAFSKTASA